MPGFPVRRLRLRAGEEHREVVPVTLEPLVFGGQTYAATPAQIPAELVVQRATTGDLFRLTFRTTLEGPCMRCLVDAAVPIEVDAQEYEARDPGADEERGDRRPQRSLVPSAVELLEEALPRRRRDLRQLGPSYVALPGLTAGRRHARAVRRAAHHAVPAVTTIEM